MRYFAAFSTSLLAMIFFIGPQSATAQSDAGWDSEKSSRRNAGSSRTGNHSDQVTTFRLDSVQLQDPQDQDAPNDLAPSIEPGTNDITPLEPRLNPSPALSEPSADFQAAPQYSPTEGCSDNAYETNYFNGGQQSGDCGYGNCGYGSCGCDICNLQQHKSFLFKNCCWELGGWIQGGYHDNSDGLLNNRPEELNLHQGWLFAEKRAQSHFGWDWGFRADAVYGTDAYLLQSNGNDPGNFDFQNGFDHGPQAWAFPQLYADIRYSNFNVRLGHFLSGLTYEDARSANNFFYSRSYSFGLGLPRTMSGALFSYDIGANTVTMGWTAGWNTGFERVNQGSAFFGGFKRQLSNRSSISYNVSAGNTGRLGDGYAHSIIYDRCIDCRWRYAFETSYAHLEDTSNESVGVAQYLVYRWSHKIDIGQRLEWWKSDINGTGSRSTYSYTAGINYRVGSNVVIRPEARYNWGEQFAGATVDDAVLGVDAIIRF